MRSCQCDKDGQNACACFVRPWRRQRGIRGGPALAVAVAAVVLFPGLVLADVQAVTQVGGPPNLPIPTFQETGLPSFTMPVGRPSVLPPADPSLGGGGGGTGGVTAVDATLDSRSWGALAAANATALGVNPTAIAATCMLESGCQSLGALGGSTVSGAFQMTDPTYRADIRSALAQNPSLAGSIDTSLAGKMDPANEAIAAAQDLKNAANALQSAGIPNPTVLDTRGYYNFGPGPGIAIAQAGDGASMASILSHYYSPSQMAANGITSATTVGQWRQTVTSKLGSAANQSVLL